MRSKELNMPVIVSSMVSPKIRATPRVYQA